MRKYCFLFFAGLYLGSANAQTTVQQQEQQMQPLTQEQMQRLEQARKRKAQKPALQKPAAQKPSLQKPALQKPALKTQPVIPPQQVQQSRPQLKKATTQVKNRAPVKKTPSPPPPPPPPTNDSLDSMVDLSTPAHAPTETVMKRRAPVGPSKAFFYVSTSYLSFADQIFAKVNGQKSKARSVFTGYNFGTDYTKYFGRYVFSWNLNYLTGVVDIQRVLGTTYPRKTFYGVQSGPEIGYRVNADMDFTWGVSLLYRDIEKVGQSFAMSNQLAIRFRFSPRLTFFQTLGNYGKPTSYSYSIGLRWLL